MTTYEYDCLDNCGCGMAKVMLMMPMIVVTKEEDDDGADSDD